MPTSRARAGETPIDDRPCRLALAVLFAAALLVPSAVAAQERTTLDVATVVARAVAASPLVRVAEARVERARAQRVGANVLVRENPTVSLWGGPRQLSGGEWVPDVILTLTVPFDFSGARGARVDAAEGLVRLAEAEAEEARQEARQAALALRVRVLAAQARVAVQRLRVQIEETDLRIAETRQRAGVAGLDEVALATVSLALARGALASAEATAAGTLAELRGRLGLAPDASVVIVGELVEASALPPLDVLIVRLGRRADVQRALRSTEASSQEARLQSRLGVPVPRLGLGGGRENEYYARIGVDWAVPLFQRNQTAVAVAQAGVRVGQIEREALRAQAETELRAAYALHDGAREAWRVLEEALPAAARSEQLATRAYELGQRDLESTVVVLRQTYELRVAHLAAAVDVAEARRAIDRAVGGL